MTTYLQTGKTGQGIVVLPKGFTYQGRKISLDVESGAPLSVRAVVGNREDPQERLELLKKYNNDLYKPCYPSNYNTHYPLKKKPNFKKNC